MSFPSCALELPAPSDLQDAIEQSVKRLQGGSKVAVTLASKARSDLLSEPEDGIKYAAMQMSAFSSYSEF